MLSGSRGAIFQEFLCTADPTTWKRSRIRDVDMSLKCGEEWDECRNIRLKTRNIMLVADVNPFECAYFL